MQAPKYSLHALALLGAFLVATIVVYWPGLHGGFVYDDATSIVTNNSIHVKDGTFAEWSLAAISIPSGTPPFRSLTMLTFAANYFLGGSGPYAFKLTNLCIHLLNGLLLFLVLRSLFEMYFATANRPGQEPRFNGEIAAAIIAGLWLLLPIQVTAVLYVVQRLESLSTTFVFLGLWWYLRARMRLWQGTGGAFSLWASIGVSTSLGILAKEPAIMLPLYAALVELCFTGGRNRDGKISRQVVALYTCTLLIPLLVGLAWMWGRYFGLANLVNPDSYVVRRVLTEAGVMLDYMAWTLVPSLDSLTLYHDDIQLANGLLDPVKTLPSVLAVVALAGLAIWQRKRRPLFSLGIFWFFAGHLLTGTIVPLVLAFEHRNYFPSVGLLLAASSVAVLEGGLSRMQARVGLITVAALLYAGTTWMRSQEWSDPMRLSTSDALKRPDSPAAQFDFALGLIQQARNSGKNEYVDAALKLLDEKRHLPGAGMIFEQNMITVLSPSGYAIPGEVWSSLVDKLAKNRANNNDARSLSQLNNCFISDKCKKEDLPRLQDAYTAVMKHPNPSPTLLSVHAEFAWYLANDHDLAEREMREAARLAPRDVPGLQNLIVVLINQGKTEEAEKMIESLEQRNHLGSLDGFIKPLRYTLKAYEDRTREKESSHQ
jgi:protein O-mannosyl-transferase